LIEGIMKYFFQVQGGIDANSHSYLRKFQRRSWGKDK